MRGKIRDFWSSGQKIAVVYDLNGIYCHNKDSIAIICLNMVKSSLLEGFRFRKSYTSGNFCPELVNLRNSAPRWVVCLYGGACGERFLSIQDALVL